MRTRSRRIVALTAAYVIALQAMLLPLSVVANASFASGLCASSIEASQPVSHETGCPCAAGCGMQCCAEALGGLPPRAAVLELTYARVIAPAPVLKAVARPAAKGPQIPRAPPAA